MNWKKEDNLNDLLNLMRENPENEDVIYYVALSYELYNEHERAAKYYEESAAISSDLERKLTILSLASLAYARSGNKNKSLSVSNQCLSVYREFGKGLSVIYGFWADISKELGNIEDYKIFMEAYLELVPEAHNRRFSLAYKYAEDGENSAALFHYKFLSEWNSDSTYLNNLGVALTALKLPSLSVTAYRKAEKMGSTLAMSNLANKFITEGFLDEAMDLAKKATSIENYDERIGFAINSVRETKDNEEEEQNQLIETFTRIRKFYIDYSNACLKEDLQTISQNWKGIKCPLAISINGDKFEAIGYYEKNKYFFIKEYF